MTPELRQGGGGLAACLATLGPVGKCPVAPGTAGTAVGFAAYLFLATVLHPPDFVYWIACGLFPLLAAPLCHAAEKRIGREDAPEIVLDEFVAVPTCFLGTMTPSVISHLDTAEISLWLVAAFVFFRFFDITKPLGIRASQRLPNGWGVVVDDALAALCVAVCLNVCWRWLELGP